MVIKTSTLCARVASIKIISEFCMNKSEILLLYESYGGFN